MCGAENSTVQLTSSPPSAPVTQCESSYVVPQMKMELTAWILCFPLESGRGWRPVKPKSDWPLNRIVGVYNEFYNKEYASFKKQLQKSKADACANAH